MSLFGGIIDSVAGIFSGGGGGQGGIGNSQSASQQATTSSTTSNDNRIVQGESGLLATGGGTINALDNGAIGKSFDFAKAQGETTSRTVDEVLGLARDVFAGGISVLDKAGGQAKANSDLVAKAYDNAKGTGDEKTLVIVAALAVLAIAGLKAWSATR